MNGYGCLARGPYVGPRCVYEGAPAPGGLYVSLLPFGRQSLQVGAVDLATGRFGWVDPSTGLVTNTAVAGGPLGLIVPRFGFWSLGYWDCGTWYLRSGMGVTLAARGAFFVRFPQGATIGQPVYADPATGLAYTADAGGYQLTPWRTASGACADGLGIISQDQLYIS